jgi:threonylcarbamoyladenosine tRNA methylthiotransferase MtaB
MEITGEMISAAEQGICRHFHIPLQSGDDSILAAMNRGYSAQFYGDLIQRISGLVPGIALGADVIAGFPGEGEQEFHNTLSFIESSPLTHLHVFSFSSRPGTRADSMSSKVQDRIIKARSEELRALGRKKNLQFREKQRNLSFSVVVEDKIDPAHNLYTGLTDNYIRVLIMGAKAEHIGNDVRIQLTDVRDRDNFGVII